MFKNQKIWRNLSYFWSLVAVIFLIIDFLDHEKYGYLFNYVGVIYLSVLGYYAGTKEFNRWKNIHENAKHPGEWFIIVWTLLVFILLISSAVLKNQVYKLSPEALSVYIGIVTIFAATRRSKYLYRKKRLSN